MHNKLNFEVFIMNKRALGKHLLACAVLSFLFAVICFAMPSGNEEYLKSYGGDAYTGIQNAAAETANNIVVLIKIFKRVSGGFFVLLGIFLYGVGQYISASATSENADETKKESQGHNPYNPQQNQNEPARSEPDERRQVEQAFKRASQAINPNVHPGWSEGTALYVYKDTTECHSNRHNIIPATIELTGKRQQRIELSVEYCAECHVFYIRDSVRQQYLYKYGVLIGNLQEYLYF